MSGLTGPSIALNEYLNPDETIYFRTETKLVDSIGETEGSGGLALTESRLVFVDGDRALEIDPQAIEEMVYYPSYLPLGRIIGVVFLVLVIGWLLAGSPGLDVDSILNLIVASGIGMITVGFAASAVSAYGPRLVIKTSQSTYRWKGGDLRELTSRIQAV